MKYYVFLPIGPEEDENLVLDHLLQIPEDVTGSLLNVFHDFASSNYTFEEDFATQQEILFNDNYYARSNISQPEWNERQNNIVAKNMNHGEIYDLCTSSIVNSSIALSCGPYFDQDIMNAIQICYYGKADSKHSLCLLKLPR